MVLNMNRQMKGSLYMLYANNLFSFLTFWSVIVALVVLSLVLTYLFPDSNNGMTLSAPTYVYGAVIGAMFVNSLIPYLVKLGVTRQTVFFSVGIFSLVLVVINAMLVVVIESLLKIVYPYKHAHNLTIETNGNTMVITHIADVFENKTFVTMAVVDISISFFVLVVAFVISLLFYRYGMLIGFVTLGLFVFAIIFSVTQGWFKTLFWAIFSDFSIVFFYQLFAFAILLFCLSYFMLRDVAIKT